MRISVGFFYITDPHKTFPVCNQNWFESQKLSDFPRSKDCISLFWFYYANFVGIQPFLTTLTILIYVDVTAHAQTSNKLKSNNNPRAIVFHRNGVDNI